jgi:hypothetical protein
MKTQLSLLAIGAFFLHSTGITPPQFSDKAFTPTPEVKVSVNNVNSGFTFFRAHRQTKNGATATWGFSSCTGVSAFEVQRNVFFPVEDWAWETVAVTPCTGVKSYKHMDAPIEAGYNSYRVVAIMNDGSQIASDVETIRIISH